MAGIVLIVAMTLCAGSRIELAARVKRFAGQLKFLGHLAGEGNCGAIGCDLLSVFVKRAAVIL